MEGTTVANLQVLNTLSNWSCIYLKSIARINQDLGVNANSLSLHDWQEEKKNRRSVKAKLRNVLENEILHFGIGRKDIPLLKETSERKLRSSPSPPPCKVYFLQRYFISPRTPLYFTIVAKIVQKSQKSSATF